jgi:hypothetical protein
MLRAWTGRAQKLRIMREHERRRANFNVCHGTIVGWSRESTDFYIYIYNIYIYMTPGNLLKGAD